MKSELVFPLGWRLDKFSIKRPSRGKGSAEESPEEDENNAQEQE
ncbi:MAG: hypothetical protein ACREAB_16990 [Blastocatellia bacterium]